MISTKNKNYHTNELEFEVVINDNPKKLLMYLTFEEPNKNIKLHIDDRERKAKYTLTEKVSLDYMIKNVKDGTQRKGVFGNTFHEEVELSKMTRNIAILQHIWREISFFEPERDINLFFPHTLRNEKFSIGVVAYNPNHLTLTLTLTYEKDNVNSNAQISANILHAAMHVKFADKLSKYKMKWKNLVASSGPTDYSYDVNSKKYTLNIIVRLLYFMQSYLSQQKKVVITDEFSIRTTYNPERYVQHMLPSLYKKESTENYQEDQRYLLEFTKDIIKRIFAHLENSQKSSSSRCDHSLSPQEK